ncbi:MAG TPA: bile acid:sodium symporter family protein [Turneriella sp.]|nr:bile acid:sodium symporter family protein [Turneriella sp.]
MNQLTQYFPFIAAAASLLALFEPTLFTWFNTSLIKIALAFIMFFTGLSLHAADFRRVVKNPRPVVIGFILQYSVMPTIGYLAAQFFHLPKELAAGLILVACCPGGTASNVISYLAKADVPLSVSMTACSTLAAVFFTPVLSSYLIGSRVPVDAWAMMFDTVLVILLPIFLALLLKRTAVRIIMRLEKGGNFIAVLLITLIVASIIGSSRTQIFQGGFTLVLAVLTLHTGGFFFGYILSRFFKLDLIRARTVSIEVGMQNSGLGVVLATKHLSALAAVPCAISSLVHSLIGSIVAAWWSRRSHQATENSE